MVPVSIFAVYEVLSVLAVGCVITADCRDGSAGRDVRVDTSVVLFDRFGCSLVESSDDGRAGDDMRIRDLGPLCYAVVAGCVLLLNGACVCRIRQWLAGTQGSHTPNVGKLAVFKDHKVLSPRNLPQGLPRALGPVSDNVTVRLQDADRVSDLFGKREQLSRGFDVRRQTQVGLLDGYETQQVRRERACGGESGAFAVGGCPGGVGIPIRNIIDWHCKDDVQLRGAAGSE